MKRSCPKCNGFGEYSHESELNPGDPYGGLVLCDRCSGTGAVDRLEEPRTRPIQGGWLEKDCVTGEVREPIIPRYK